MVCFSHATSPTEIYTLSLHDALPICGGGNTKGDSKYWGIGGTGGNGGGGGTGGKGGNGESAGAGSAVAALTDRKSTRLNSSHLGISYAVFCLKKKKNNEY